MLDLLTGLGAEVVATGIVGLLMLGVVVRNVFLGWNEALKKMKAAESGMTPMATAVAIGWDRDQIERALQTLEAIAEALALNSKHAEAISKAQGILADQFQQSTREKLEDILERLDKAERDQTRPVTRSRR